MEGVVFNLDHKSNKRSRWVVYLLHDSHGIVQYIGHCRWSEIEQIPDAKSHSKFNAIFDAVPYIPVKILGTFEQKSEAEVCIRQWLHDKPRPFMMQFFRSFNNTVGVKCVETGEEFKSIAEASDKHGIDRSNLSRHLRGDPNYRHVKGRTYIRNERKV